MSYSMVIPALTTADEGEVPWKRLRTVRAQWLRPIQAVIEHDSAEMNG